MCAVLTKMLLHPSQDIWLGGLKPLKMKPENISRLDFTFRITFQIVNFLHPTHSRTHIISFLITWLAAFTHIFPVHMTACVWYRSQIFRQFRKIQTYFILSCPRDMKYQIPFCSLGISMRWWCGIEKWMGCFYIFWRKSPYKKVMLHRRYSI